MIFNPVTSNFDASTVPKGPRRAQMILERTNAPLWLASASSFINKVIPALCAEDGAAFNLETSVSNGITTNSCMLEGELFLVC